ncbi:MAG: hypothetical protein AAB404_03030 [Patescibacteria group bacterium]
MNTAIFFRIWRFIRIPLIAILVLFVGLVIYRIPVVMEKQKTDEAVLRIHAQKITLDDVMGKNLPPDPGADADKTVQGIDVNQNGIRDDVELAIFREYPDSAKTRAVLLQYALALQMEATQKIVNKETVTEVVREQSRAYSCVGEIFSREDMNKYIEESDKLNFFVSERQRNTPERKKARKDFVKNIGSYSESENEVCDINLSTLSD